MTTDDVTLTVTVGIEELLSGTDTHSRRQIVKDIDDWEGSVDFSLQIIRDLAASLIRHDNIPKQDIIEVINNAVADTTQTGTTQ